MYMHMRRGSTAPNPRLVKLDPHWRPQPPCEPGPPATEVAGHTVSGLGGQPCESDAGGKRAQTIREEEPPTLPAMGGWMNSGGSGVWAPSTSW